MRPFDMYDDLLDRVDEIGAPYRVLDRAPGGAPIVGVEAGGEKEPAIFLTAGSHATEHAGVVATVELIDRLETDHRVYVLPCRDPVGLDGYAAALDLSVGGGAPVDDYGDVEPFLRSEGEVVYEEEDLVLALIGDYGYAVGTEEYGSVSILLTLKDLAADDPSVLEPFAGRRIYTPPGHTGIDATEGLERAYTLVVDPGGTPLHLNRFFTSAWAPAECRSVRALVDEIEPGLTFDNHETTGHGDCYHVSLRPQRTDELDERERDVGLAMADAVTEYGGTLAADEDVIPGASSTTVGRSDDEPEKPFYWRAGDGAFWADPNATDPPRRGEGFNAPDYAAEHYGLAFTNETGMYGSFEQRVEMQIAAVKAAVRKFERYHA